MDKQLVKTLLSKYNAGLASQQERAQLENWYLSKSDSLRLEEGEIDFSAIEDRLRQRTFAAAGLIDSREVSRRGLLGRSAGLWTRVSVAAAVVLSLGLGIYFYANRVKVDNGTVIAANDMAPGSVGATLTLANGKKIVLSGAQNGELAKEAGVVISKSADGQLVYEIKGENKGLAAQINTLSTAIGETYIVVLPDQSKVWMNAASTLTYSSAMARLDRRTVELSGEAYFEVAKDKAHPFIVKSASQQVEVLGTHFNVNTYNEKAMSTTLLEGSVRVAVGAKVQLIRPGEQSVASVEGIAVKEVEAEDVIAWKNGYFMFSSESLESIMGKLSRWYGVKVEFTDASLKQRTFFGSVSKYVNISQVLKKLNATGKTEFVLVGDKVVVSAKK